jgi:5'-methylthioadenosine phosphorylase
MAMITDYDSWKEDEEHVTVDRVIELLHQNAETAKRIIRKVIPTIPRVADWPEHRALENAVLTNPALWPAKKRADLKPILKRYCQERS